MRQDLAPTWYSNRDHRFPSNSNKSSRETLYGDCHPLDGLQALRSTIHVLCLPIHHDVHSLQNVNALCEQHRSSVSALELTRAPTLQILSLGDNNQSDGMFEVDAGTTADSTGLGEVLRLHVG